MEPSGSGTLQDADQGFWSNVPEEITARIMARLPVPFLCTCRAVCKAWNDLLRRPSFIDLCDRDEKKDDSAYLFVTVHFVSDWNRNVVHGNYRHTTRFLDLQRGRWYSIGSRIPSDADVLFLAMNDGLICEFSVVGEECRLVMFDPVSTTTRALPAVNVPASRIFREDPPAIVTLVHSSSFNVFVLSHSGGLHTGFSLYDSSTDAWRDLRSPMEELGLAGILRVKFVESAVYFQGTFYAAFCTFKGILLGRYNLEENSWKEVFTVDSKHPGHPQLIVFKNRMFMPIWLDGEARGSLILTGIRRGDYSNSSMFEIREIMEDSSSKSVVNIPYLEIQRVFYGEEDRIGLEYDIACAFPINSHSVLLISRHLGKSFVYNVTNGRVAELPAHYLSHISFELSLCVNFSAKLMNLSVRNILASSSTPVACTREPIKLLENPMLEILRSRYGSEIVTNRFQQPPLSLQVASSCTQDQHLEAVDLQAVHEALQMEVKNVNGF